MPIHTLKKIRHWPNVANNITDKFSELSVSTIHNSAT